MHVPQAGNEEFTASVDDLRAGRGLEALSDGQNASAGDDDGGVFEGLGRGQVGRRQVDDGGALDEEGLASKRGQEEKQGEKNQHEKLIDYRNRSVCCGLFDVLDREIFNRSFGGFQLQA